MEYKVSYSGSGGCPVQSYLNRIDALRMAHFLEARGETHIRIEAGGKVLTIAQLERLIDGNQSPT